MTFLKTSRGRLSVRQAIALLSCLALLYFAAGGAFLHEHKDGRGDTPCHVCQALHLPALAPASVPSVRVPEFFSWYFTQPVHTAPREAFSFHHAGRAPPVA